MLVIGNEDVLVFFFCGLSVARKLSLEPKGGNIEGDHVLDVSLALDLVALAFYDAGLKKICLADELGDELGGRAFVNFVWCADLQDMTVIHNRNSV